MALRDLNIKAEYRTKISNIPKDFIVPLLNEGVLYKRAVGFFSSSALLEISKGIGTLISSGGRIQLVASPNLSKEDIEAIDRGYKSRRDTICESLLRELPDRDSLSLEEKDRFNLLAYLIANDFMDIKIAVVDDNNGLGIYHEKLGLVEDANGDIVAFTGSMNESKTGMLDNYGAIDVFKSWNDPEGRVSMKSAAFSSIWNGSEIGISTYEFPEVAETIKANYLQGIPKVNLDQLDSGSDRLLPEITGQFGYPRLPSIDGFEVRGYQDQAVQKWLANDGRGLFDMATGTGKTITALIALAGLYEKVGGSLFVIIACPYKHLVEQWVEDLELFGIDPIIAHSESRQRNWKKTLKDAVVDHKLGLENANFVCLISTNQSLSSDWMQKCLYRLKSDVLLIADEAHNLGAPNYRKILDPKYSYRLALSATFNRHHDDEGTEVLRHYFGETCIEYSLEQAIQDGMLTKYKYYPVPVALDDDELDEYQRLTKELGKCFKSSGGRRTITQRGEIIAQQRARVVAAARNKLEALKGLISDYSHEKHLLVYCGAASLMNDGDGPNDVDKDIKQISVVVDMLGNDLGMSVSKFTSEEDMAEREILKKEFSDGNIQALVAIKCLDEGVNIPSIRTAFMLSSTTNPKEYIQRRGRLLRLSPGKEFAEIYDLITLPFSVEDASSLPLDEIRGMYTLINNELERGFEFARYAHNFSEAQTTLDKVSESYRLDELRMLIERREREA